MSTRISQTTVSDLSYNAVENTDREETITSSSFSICGRKTPESVTEEITPTIHIGDSPHPSITHQPLWVDFKVFRLSFTKIC